MGNSAGSSIQMSTTVIILSAAVFVALILNLAVKSELGDFLTGGAAFLAMAGGLILYSLAYTELDQDVPLAIVRTLYAVCGMFMGKNESPTVGNCAVLKPLWTRLLFWFFHVCALYATASAAIKTVGERAMRQLRLFLLRRGRLVVIYGARADTVSFGQQMLARRKCSVVFVDEHPDPSCIQTIRDSGCVLRADRAATTPGRAFLNSVGVYSGTGRRISLFALQQSEAANLRFARGFLSALSAQSVSPDHTDLLLLGGEQIIGDSRMDEAEDAAKKLMRLTVLSGLIGGAIILGAMPFVLRFANLTPTGKGYLRVMLLINSYYVMGAAVNTTLIAGVFRAGGDSRFGFVCDTIDMWVYAVPLGFLAAAVLKLPPLWVYFLLCTDEFVKWPWVIRHYRRRKWLRNITREDLFESA